MRDVLVVGSGMGALSAAAMVCTYGLKPLIIEQNWIPGGCTTSYPRKGFVFEAGATTLVGTDEHMPLRHLMDHTGIEIPMRKLNLPMQVHLSGGMTINRHENLDAWKAESAKHFGAETSPFWDAAYKVSQFVWQASTRYLHFPPEKPVDLLKLALKARIKDISKIPLAFKSTAEVLDHYGLDSPKFRAFVDQQLLITAQNTAEQVNWLFGAAALCYTNYSNHYVDGGLRNLVNPIVEFILKNGGEIVYRNPVKSIHRIPNGYELTTKAATYSAKYLISGIPLNNLMEVVQFDLISHEKVMESSQLFSAFQMGIAFRPHKNHEALHHQIHLPEPMPETSANSIFLSLSHPEDSTRAEDSNVCIASISTHIPDPHRIQINGDKLEAYVIETLAAYDFIQPENIIYQHSSGPKSWQKWTGRSFGFVGGYPQYMHIKPWQMVGARLDGKRAYHCGDTAYPGQGIPGATLSGIIAASKLKSDWL